MTRITMIAKGLTVACSVMAGAAASVFFMQDLLPMNLSGVTAALGDFAWLISDYAVSMMAGSLLGWLVYFCIWDCLGKWLGTLWLHLRNKLQLGDGSAPGVGQIG